MSKQLAKNLKWLMDANNFKNPTVMAQHLKIPQPTLFRLFVGASKEPKAATVEKIAAYFQLTPSQLMETDLETGEAIVKPVLAPIARLEVPVLKWENCHDYKLLTDRPPELETLPVVTSKPGRHAFALRVELDVMAPLFVEKDCYIVVDPQRKAQSGDYIVCRTMGSDLAIVRRLMREGSKCYLTAVNPAYPTIHVDEKDLEILGVVCESHIIKKL